MSQLGLGSTGQVGQFRAAMEKAQGVFRGAPGVNNYDPWEIYHTTINCEFVAWHEGIL